MAPKGGKRACKEQEGSNNAEVANDEAAKDEAEEPKMMEPPEETANMEGAAGSKAPKGQNADDDAVLNAHMQQEHEEEVEAGALVSEASAASVMTAPMREQLL